MSIVRKSIVYESRSMRKIITKIDDKGDVVKFGFAVVGKTDDVTKITFAEFRDSDLPMGEVCEQDQVLILSKLSGDVPDKKNAEGYHRWCREENPSFWDKVLVLIGSGADWRKSGLIVNKTLSVNQP